jgi:hypothetical protein
MHSLTAVQDKERELQQQLIQARALNVAAACARGAPVSRAPLPNAFSSQARAALESMDKKSLSEAQSLHSFEAKELER